MLSTESAAAMTRDEAELPERRTLGDSIGLAWLRYGWSGERLIGHDGNTLGQAAFLLIHPGHRLAITLLTNGGKTLDLHAVLLRRAFSELAGIAMPPPLSRPRRSRRSSGAATRVATSGPASPPRSSSGGTGLALRTTVTGPLAALVPEPVQENELVPIEPDLFAIRAPETETWVP